MSRLIFVLVIAFAFTINDSQARMDCSGLYTRESTNIITKVLNSCPTVFSPSDAEFCCLDPFTQEVTCCNAAQYFFNFSVFGLILLGLFVVASVIVSCICCVCCSCCPWYKKRHRGTVYSRRPVV